MTARRLIARGRNAPEATQGALVTLPAVRPFRPFQCPRRDGRQTPLSLEKARKRRILALKSKRSADTAHIRWRVVVRLRGSYAAMTSRARGGDCAAASQPRVLAARSQPVPRGGAGGRRGGWTTPPHETLRLGVRSLYGRHGAWAKARAWYRIQRAGPWRSPAYDTGGRSRRQSGTPG